MPQAASAASEHAKHASGMKEVGSQKSLLRQSHAPSWFANSFAHCSQSAAAVDSMFPPQAATASSAEHAKHPSGMKEVGSQFKLLRHSHAPS